MDCSLLAIDDYNLFCKDRTTGQGGGVCVCIKHGIPCIQQKDLESNLRKQGLKKESLPSDLNVSPDFSQA